MTPLKAGSSSSIRGESYVVIMSDAPRVGATEVDPRRTELTLHAQAHDERVQRTSRGPSRRHSSSFLILYRTLEMKKVVDTHAFESRARTCRVTRISRRTARE